MLQTHTGSLIEMATEKSPPGNTAQMDHALGVILRLPYVLEGLVEFQIELLTL